MTMHACPKCGKNLIRDNEKMCFDCKIAQVAGTEEKEKQPFPTQKILLGLLIVPTSIVILVSAFVPDRIEKPPEQPAQRELVSNSGWDGSVPQVERWLKHNLKDPESFQAIDWFPVIRSGNGFLVRCRYRAKNSFGGYVIDDKIFQLSHVGEVTAVVDFNPAGTQ